MATTKANQQRPCSVCIVQRGTHPVQTNLHMHDNSRTGDTREKRVYGILEKAGSIPAILKSAVRAGTYLTRALSQDGGAFVI